MFVQYLLPEELCVDILSKLLENEPVANVAPIEHPVHSLVVHRLADLELEREAAQLGDGDGRDPVEDVDGGEDEEEDIPEVEEDEYNLVHVVL